MNLISLGWKNVINKPLNMLLTIILFALGIGLMIFLLLTNHQIKENFDKNLAGIDMVIGAKGSPLQMILCNMYHIDNPTGNITIENAKPFLNPKHPLIKTSIPLSLGDSYKGFRIVGTDHAFPTLYNAKLSGGSLFNKDYEVNIGHKVARDLGLDIGHTFRSVHGFQDDEDLQHDHDSHFRVAGIFEQSGSVLDQLILCNTPSIWHVHHTASHDELEDDHNHEDHEHHSASHFNILEYPEEEITSLLIKFRNRNFQTLNLPRNINENTDMQAASPAIEINRLYSMLGFGADLLQKLALLIALVSGISIFISLYSTLKERKYEMALMRVNGASPWQLLTLILSEGLILSIIGCILGLALGHLSVEFFAGVASEKYNYSFSGFKVLKSELLVVAASLIIGILASSIPALIAFRTEINDIMSKE